MGLDMCLKASVVLNKEQSERVCDMLNIANKDIIAKFAVGYWRKANAIHQWFVKNVQGGKDDCREAYCDINDLLKLKELCEKVISNPEIAEELLPTMPGFFFGPVEYDDYYFNDLRNTIKIIEEAQKLVNILGKNIIFYYVSSW